MARAKAKESPRKRALDVLCQVFEKGAYANLALQAALRGVDSRDAALVKQLVFGTVTYRQSLDYLLQRWLTRPLVRLDASVRNILRLGLYQVLYLDMPDHAAVSESVNLARAVTHQGSAGMVNAVLRRAVREQEQLPWPKTGDQAYDLSIRYSFPQWITNRWLERLGAEQTERFCQAQNQAPGVDLRVNSLRATPEQVIEALAGQGIAAAAHPLVPGSLRISGGSLPGLQVLQDGRCSVQGAASTLVGLVVSPKTGELVYDLCAAPGGKSLHMAELMQNQGRVVAFDLHAGRLQLVTRAAKRLSVDSVQTVAADARSLPPSDWPQADRVLVDAPCSGMGVIRRKPDIRWQRQPEELAALSELQGEILQAAARLVRPGGILVYSVCSTEPEESTAVIERFLRLNSDYQPAEWPKPLQAIWIDRLSAGHLTTYPHLDDLDGFFICRLRRSS